MRRDGGSPRDVPRVFAAAAPNWEARLEAKGGGCPCPSPGRELKAWKKFVFISIYCHWVGGGSEALLFFPLQVRDEAPNSGGCTPSPMGLPGHSEGGRGPKWREGVTLLEAGGLC